MYQPVSSLSYSFIFEINYRDLIIFIWYALLVLESSVSLLSMTIDRKVSKNSPCLFTNTSHRHCWIIHSVNFNLMIKITISKLSLNYYKCFPSIQSIAPHKIWECWFVQKLSKMVLLYFSGWKFGETNINQMEFSEMLLVCFSSQNHFSTGKRDKCAFEWQSWWKNGQKI